MADLEISADLVGQVVCNPGRPQWGTGTVLRVQTTMAGGQPQHRVSVQFSVGHKVLLIPPARLARPGTAPTRAGGWLEKAAGTNLDGRLRGLPDFVTDFLGTPRQRLLNLAPLYAVTDEPKSLADWARQQTGVADPLAHWSRDELHQAFGEFCSRRDHALRTAAAVLEKSAAGRDAVARALAGLEAPLRTRMEAVLGAGGR